MFEITKRMEISAAHKLELDYDSKCTELHGHNWIIEVTIQSKNLDDAGMVVDFGLIKETVMLLDHKNLNDFLHQPTAEGIAEWVAFKIQSELFGTTPGERPIIESPQVTSVTVQESEGNKACYIP